MNCKETLKRVELLLDGELTDAEKQTVISHLEDCNDCESRYEAERCFKEFLQKALVRKNLSSGTIDNIRSAVANTVV